MELGVSEFGMERRLQRPGLRAPRHLGAAGRALKRAPQAEPGLNKSGVAQNSTDLQTAGTLVFGSICQGAMLVVFV